MLTPSQRAQLLRIARQSIESAVQGQRAEVGAIEAELQRPSGAFVSLHIKNGGDLRGCIGSIRPVAPLAEAVRNNAVNAAMRDPRFHPLRKNELAQVQIEISVLSPVEVTPPDEIVVGRDGLIVSMGSGIGLLLPQVAADCGWDRETFLAQTCRKAGLPADAWRSPKCRIERFAAEVFSE